MPDVVFTSPAPTPRRQPRGAVVASAWALSCALGLTTLGTLPAQAREGVEVGQESRFAKLVSADTVENAANQKYAELMQQARAQNALFPDNHPQVVRLRDIARRIIPYTLDWNPRARQWSWQVNLINAKEINAFCMPGGKIVFYSAIIDKLKLTDDEIAIVMGHETAHALREHARSRMGKAAATGIAAGLVSQLLGLSSTGDQLLNMGNQLLNLKFSRSDETEADLVGMELAARAGYDPRAGISLWQKMAEAAKGAPPEFISTHPSDNSRIKQIQANLPKVMPLYERAAKPPKR